MDLVARAQGILLKPKEEWTKIKDETITISELFTSYAIILAASPAVAQFIGLGLIGFGRPYGGWARYGIGRAFFFGIIFYIFALASVYVFGLVINLLAPSFSSKQDNVSAMKLAVYSMTPSWVAGVLYLIPLLGFLALIAGLYGIYILYLGFATPLMDTPKEKVAVYMVVSVIVYIVIWVVITLILGSIFAVGAVTGAI
jgi:hypothetical protein